jgi:hypothetical protein
MLRLLARRPLRRSRPLTSPRYGGNPRALPGLATTVFLLAPVAAALAFARALPAAGQTAEAPPATTATKDQPAPNGESAPAAAGATDFLEIEGLGLRLRPLQPSFGKSETVEGVQRYELVDAEASPRWWLIFQNLTSSTAGTTARSQLEAYLETLRKNGKPFDVRVNENFTVAGASDEARLLLIERPVNDEATGISGWLIIPNGPDRFLTCSIAAPTRTFDAIWPEVQKSLRSIEVRSAEAIAQSKRQRMETGAKVLDFTREDLKAALGAEPTCYRMYRPGAAADKDPKVRDERELGWLVMRSREAMRGEVDPKADPKKLRGEDADPGILVQIDAKSIVNDDATNTVDTQIRAWLSWDRTEEVWSVRNTQRQGSGVRSSAQTGVRTPARRGDPRPMLRVINSTAEKLSRDPEEWAVPPNYISQAELMILGRLLPKDNPGPQTFSSYAFEPRTNGLPQRRDTWKREADGTWTLETFLGGASVPLVQSFSADGERLRRVDVDAFGTVITEKIDLAALKALWRSKGLPVE